MTMMQAGLWAATQVSVDRPPTVNSPTALHAHPPVLRLLPWGDQRGVLKGRRQELGARRLRLVEKEAGKLRDLGACVFAM